MPDQTFLAQVIAVALEVKPDLGEELRFLTRDIADEHEALIQVVNHLDLVVLRPLRSAFGLRGYLDEMRLSPERAFIDVRGPGGPDHESTALRYRLIPDPVFRERERLQRAVRLLDEFVSTVRSHFSDPDPDPGPDSSKPPGGPPSVADAPSQRRSTVPDSQRRNEPRWRRKK